MDSLLRYLPAIYHEDELLGRFLRAFETVLLGDDADGERLAKVQRLEAPIGFKQLKGLENKIAALPHCFDPQRAPEDFLAWLTGWTGFALRADLPPEKQRDFIASAISLYRMRGTKANMERLLEIFTSRKATVRDDLPGEPFHFRVGISLDKPDEDYIAQQQATAHALIEREKPAHTSYRLVIYFPKMKIGACYVGKNTVLSGTEEEPNGSNQTPSIS
jgi:P2-related tail formation protein